MAGFVDGSVWISDIELTVPSVETWQGDLMAEADPEGWRCHHWEIWIQKGDTT